MWLPSTLEDSGFRLCSPRTTTLHNPGLVESTNMEKYGTKENGRWWAIYNLHTFSFFFFSFIFISWRLINLQYCSGFCHTLTWISHEFTCVPHPEPPPTSFPIPSLWVIPVHQPWALVSCIQAGLVICFTLDDIYVSMLFFQIIPPSPSPRVQKSILYICVSFSVLHIGLSLPSF